MYQNRWKISGNFLDLLGENLDFRFNYTPKCMVLRMNFQNFSGEELAVDSRALCVLGSGWALKSPLQHV